jgi:hypothetical protein
VSILSWGRQSSVAAGRHRGHLRSVAVAATSTSGCNCGLHLDRHLQAAAYPAATGRFRSSWRRIRPNTAGQWQRRVASVRSIGSAARRPPLIISVCGSTYHWCNGGLLASYMGCLHMQHMGLYDLFTFIFVMLAASIEYLSSCFLLSAASMHNNFG